MTHVIVNPHGKPYTRGRYLIEIIDLCGRQAPRAIDAYDPDQWATTGLTDEDFDHICEQHDAGNTAYIGEFEYRKAA